jgi:hypothetical protein
VQNRISGFNVNLGGAWLTRPQTITNSYQEITIPQRQWAPQTWLANNPSQAMGSWGLLTRGQTSNPSTFGLNARGVVAYAQWLCYTSGGPGSPVNTSLGSLNCGLDIVRWDGSITGLLWFDYLPFGSSLLWDNPGNGFILGLETKTDPANTACTKFTVTLFDGLTHATLIGPFTSFCYEQGLASGYVGIAVGTGNCSVSNYVLR